VGGTPGGGTGGSAVGGEAGQGNAAGAEPLALDGYNYVLGTQNIKPSYGFTDEPDVVEAAKAIAAMGSNMIKLSAGQDLEPFYALPFRTYFFWFRSQSSSWFDGFSEAEAKTEYDATYAFTKALLERFKGTGRRFFLGHWEGDWYLLPNYDTNYVPSDTTLKGMTDWFNARQRAVDDAKRDFPHPGVEVWHYAEVNKVVDAREQGKKRLVNYVLPNTNVDYVSYSAYDVQQRSQGDLNATLDYVVGKLKPKAGLSGKRVFIGEFGLSAAKTGYDPDVHEQQNREIMIKFLNWGAPYILYWEMFNNEVKDNKQVGFWLIDDKNVKWPLYHTLADLFSASRAHLTSEHQRLGRPLSLREYQSYASKWLSER
jgi:hypothetical protein